MPILRWTGTERYAGYLGVAPEDQDKMDWHPALPSSVLPPLSQWEPPRLSQYLGQGNPVIDDFTLSIATSIKSMNLIGASPSYIRSQILSSAEKVANFIPRNWGAAKLAGQPVNGRNLI